jgi:outer membrane cobalamin receptor
MKKYFFLIVLLLFVSPVFLLAQNTGSIKGKIIDANSNTNLPGVNIVVNGITFGTVSDTKGYYELSKIPIGIYKITASMIGYEKLTKKVKIEGGKTKNLDFKLKESIQSIEEVQITAKSEIQEQREAPEAITVIDAKEIRGRATSLESVLTKAAGVKIRKTGGLGSASRINIHGLEGKRIQIFIDDLPINSPDGSFVIDDIPIDLIERIEVYKGIVPARFGGDGIGGAINIVTREYNTDYIDLSYQRGSYNTNRASWVFKKVFQKAGIEIGTGGFYNYSDNNYKFESPYQEGITLIRDNDQYLSFVSGGGITFTKLWFDEIEVGLDFYKNRKEIQGIIENYQHAETKSIAFLPSISLEKEDFFLKNLRFDNNFVLLTVTGSLIDTSHVHYNLDGSINPNNHSQGEIGYYPRNSSNKQNEIRNRLNLHYKISEKQSINLNNTFRYAELNPEDPLASDYAGYNVSGYQSFLLNTVTGLTHELRLANNKFINILGAKLFQSKTNITDNNLMGTSLQRTPETTENDFMKMGYSEAIRFKLTPWFNLKASYQHVMRLPKTSELFGNGIHISTAPNLVTEESNNVNAGFFIDRYETINLHRIQFEVNAFYLDLTNMIKLVGDGVSFAYTNLGRVKIKGIDAELKLDVTKQIYVHGNITVQDARDALKTEPDGTINHTYDMKVPNIPWLFSNFGAEYHKEDLFAKGTYFKVFWESSYTNEFTYNWEMSKLNPRTIPSVFTHDAGIEMAFQNNRYIASIEMHNITDEIVFNDYNMPLMGRAIYFKLRYTLTKSVNQ